jgi:hypothetical protein
VAHKLKSGWVEERIIALKSFDLSAPVAVVIDQPASPSPVNLYRGVDPATSRPADQL